MRLSLFCCALIVAGCQSGDFTALRKVAISHQFAGANATVQFIPIEGGCWVLEPDAGGRYEPINLPARYQIDGLRVYVRFSEAHNVGSVCMVGTLVTIDEIRSQ